MTPPTPNLPSKGFPWGQAHKGQTMKVRLLCWVFSPLLSQYGLQDGQTTSVPSSRECSAEDTGAMATGGIFAGVTSPRGSAFPPLLFPSHTPEILQHTHSSPCLPSQPSSTSNVFSKHQLCHVPTHRQPGLKAIISLFSKKSRNVCKKAKILGKCTHWSSETT